MILKVAKSDSLNGVIEINGAKNSALPALCAGLLTKESVTISNVPIIDDIMVLKKILTKLGVKITSDELTPDTLVIEAKKVKTKALFEEIKQIRGSYYIMGALLARFGKIKIGYPGGCKIGQRPIDYHLEAFKTLGFKVVLNDDYIDIKKAKKANLKANINITFPTKSVGATINTIFVATSVPTQTTITNPALEPEVIDVINLLNQMGANIIINQDKALIINYRRNLKGCHHQLIYDRIEAGSYLFLASSIPNSTVKIVNVDLDHLATVIVIARSLGIKITTGSNYLIVHAPQKINDIDLLIGEYPFFPTDLQQVLSAFLLKTTNKSSIKDLIFPNRYTQISELKKMQGNIDYQNQTIVIKHSDLKGSVVEAKDLRMAFALVLASGVADGVTFIKKAQLLLRGYQDPITKLKQIGFKIEVVEE